MIQLKPEISFSGISNFLLQRIYNIMSLQLLIIIFGYERKMRKMCLHNCVILADGSS